VPVVEEAGWTPEPVWTGAENLAPTGIRSPMRTAPSESLYRLSYPGPYFIYIYICIYSCVCVCVRARARVCVIDERELTDFI